MAAALKLGLVTAALFFSPTLALATDNDPTPDWTSAELSEACLASYNVCLAACTRESDSFSGQMSQDICRSGCDDTYINCQATVPVTNKRAKDLTKKAKELEGIQMEP